jgi:hypothetical protein
MKKERKERARVSETVNGSNGEIDLKPPPSLFACVSVKKLDFYYISNR